MSLDLIQMGYYPTDSCTAATTDGERDCKIGCMVEVSIAFKVNYISEDLLPVTVTSRLDCKLFTGPTLGSVHSDRCFYMGTETN